MKYFRHYKNKPYKYLGEVKHSETLDDLVLYETRYPNPSGRLWVRPKKMFFESITLEGKVTPRFRGIPLELKSYTEVSAAEIAIVAGLMRQGFGEWDPKWFHSTFDSQKHVHLGIAFMEGEAVGFKLGYELSSNGFYSWLGTVLPDFRGLGVAQGLMQLQHDWCRERGYQKIQTKTQNRFRDMLVLNVRNGFEIIGTHASDEGGLKIIMEKSLHPV